MNNRDEIRIDRREEEQERFYVFYFIVLNGKGGI